MHPDATPAFHRAHAAALAGLGALSMALASTTAAAQDQPWPVETQRLTMTTEVMSDTFFGTVRAHEITGLSYQVRGCIVEIAEDAKLDRVTKAEQVLVRLDDKRSQLALKTAEARVSELSAALAERELAIQAARADDRRRQQDLEFVAEEFERNSSMLRRGLINEAAMDAVERRFMDAQFTAERAKEGIDNAVAAKARAEIALEIGKLDVAAAQLNHDMLVLSAPFDGVLVGFDANVGDCVQEGGLAARVYRPDEKSVDVFFRISRLTAPQASGLAVGAPVNVMRVNGQECAGSLTRIDTEADPETQFVEATVDVETSCAPNLFLNESVEVETVPDAIANSFSVPNTAILGKNTVFLVDEDTQRLVAVQAEILLRGKDETILRIPDGDGRLLVRHAHSSMVDGMLVDPQETG